MMMKQSFLQKMWRTLPILIASLALAGTAGADLKIVTTIPDLADFAGRIGRDKVSVSSLARGPEDPHNVMMRPSMISSLRAADLFVVLGFDLEHAYAPALVRESRNRAIQPGARGYLDCSLSVTPLEVPTSLSRSEGDIHPRGNPHYNLDPLRMKRAAEAMARKMGELDPPNAAFYTQNAATLGAELEKRTAEWKRRIGTRRFVAYHPVWAYFAERFGVEPVATIQPKPGIEPGPRYVDALIARMKGEGIGLIVKESYFGDRLPQQIARSTGARVVTVAVQVHATRAAPDYFAMIDQIVAAFDQNGKPGKQGE